MARADIGYDFEDFGKGEAWLKAKYGDAGHPEFTLENWRESADAQANFNGYWDWVIDGIKGDDESIPGADDDIVEMQTVDQFAYAISGWHANRVARLKHMLEAPTGTEVTMDLGKGPEILKLEGRLQKGFKMGLIVALNELEKLPFAVTTEDAEPDAQSQ